MFKAFKDYYRKFFNKDSEAKTYGVHFGLKEYLVYGVIIIGLTVGVGYISSLKTPALIALLILGLLMIPFIVVAMLNQKREERRFELLNSYLTNMIPVFIQKTKIVYALEELKGVVENEVLGVTEKAKEYMLKNIDDVEAEKTGLSFIEEIFPNSRVQATHRMMLTIEKKNSKDANDTCMMMFEDIENWTNRVYAFQKDLKNCRAQLFLLAGMTLVMNTMFVYLYSTNEVFIGYDDNILYQVATTLFLAAMIIICVVGICKLNGKWIVDDLNSATDNERLKRAYDKYYQKKDTKPVGGYIFCTILIVLAGVIYLILPPLRLMSYFLAFVGLFMMFVVGTNVSNQRNTVRRGLEMEFPMWLREISISLGNYTVLNAVENSINLVSYPMQMEIQKFLNVAEKNPKDIRPYVNFAKDFGVTGIASSMKVLFSIQNLGGDEAKAQIQALVNRNQTMLAKSEEIRNKNMLSGVELLGFVPMLLFLVQMIVQMVVMMTVMMGNIMVNVEL